jgi:hypothetical protein
MNNRDFVDLIVDLISKRRVLYIILLITLSLAVYFNLKANTHFKYSVVIVDYPPDLFTEINLYESSLSTMTLTEVDWVIQDPTTITNNLNGNTICEIAKASIFDKDIFYKLTDKYINESRNNFSSREDVFEKLSGVLSIETTPNTCMKVNISGELDVVNFFRIHYHEILNEYIKARVEGYLKLVKEDKVKFYEGIIKAYSGAKDELSENGLVLSYYKTRLSSIINLKTPRVIEYYFFFKGSGVSQKINPIFIYVFGFFISILIFIISVVLLDLKKQISLRSNNRTL